MEYYERDSACSFDYFLKESKILVKITRGQKDFLCKKGYLKLKHGKYLNLVTTRRQKKNRGYYVPDYIAEYVTRDKNNIQKGNVRI